jgi:hypothetical protein
MATLVDGPCILGRGGIAGHEGVFEPLGAEELCLLCVTYRGIGVEDFERYDDNRDERRGSQLGKNAPHVDFTS